MKKQPNLKKKQKKCQMNSLKCLKLKIIINLQETLDKMTERIENAQWDNETEMAKVKNIANN